MQHADMPGFPREEQLLLSALVGGHRRQLSFEALEDLLAAGFVEDWSEVDVRSGKAARLLALAREVS